MNRRGFLGLVLGTVAAAVTKPLKALTISSPFGKHLSEFDDDLAIIYTAQKAIGISTFGLNGPKIILSPPRHFALLWRSLIPRQRFIYTVGSGLRALRFCDAIWVPADTDGRVAIFCNDGRRAWYRVPRSIMQDDSLDYVFAITQAANLSLTPKETYQFGFTGWKTLPPVEATAIIYQPHQWGMRHE